MDVFPACTWNPSIERGGLTPVLADQVYRGMTARRQRDFDACVAKFDIDRIVSPGATDIVGSGVERVGNPDALLFHETMRFAFRGTPQISAVWTAYLGHGAYRSVLTVTGNFQPDYIAELVHVARQRLDTHTPG